MTDAKIVPREPTPAMLQAGKCAMYVSNDLANTWKSMYDAAPAAAPDMEAINGVCDEGQLATRYPVFECDGCGVVKPVMYCQECMDQPFAEPPPPAAAPTEADVRRIVHEELRRFEQEHYKLFGVLRDGD